MMNDIDMLICKMNVLIDRYKKLSELPDDEMVASEIPNDIFRKAFNETSVVLAQAADTIESLSAKLDAANGERADGWILCKDRLPAEHPTMFAKLKGTPKWNNCMFETSSDRVNVTVEDDKGKVVTTHAHTIDGKWVCDLLRCNKSYKIIAWQPLPEPYHEP